ncbi:MAG: hypothetical protein ABSE07_12500 [Methanoregula sp.]
MTPCNHTGVMEWRFLNGEYWLVCVECGTKMRSPALYKPVPSSKYYARDEYEPTTPVNVSEMIKNLR